MTDEEKDEYILGLDKADVPEHKPFDDTYFWLELGFVYGVLFCVVIWLSYLWAVHVQ